MDTWNKLERKITLIQLHLASVLKLCFVGTALTSYHWAPGTLFTGVKVLQPEVRGARLLPLSAVRFDPCRAFRSNIGRKVFDSYFIL